MARAAAKKAKIDLAIQGETQINDKKKSTNKEGESTPPKGRALDTSHFNSKGVSKEGMDIIFVGPIDGKCPLPPNFPIADLNLLDNQEQNILVATWIGDSRYPQKPLEDKFLFYNNETILNKLNVFEHFSKKNRNLLWDHNIEYLCKKGQINA